MNKRLTFSDEWFPIDKDSFRILALLSDHNGSYSGNLSSMCRYFNRTAQTSNRNKIRDSINYLAEINLISFTKSGNTYSLTLSPISENHKLSLPREWYLKIKNQEYSSESVAWEQVLKVFLWLQQNQGLFTNAEIAACIGASEDVITSAKNVLKNDFAAIVQTIVREKLGDTWRTYGQEVDCSAWWSKT